MDINEKLNKVRENTLKKIEDTQDNQNDYFLNSIDNKINELTQVQDFNSAKNSFNAIKKINEIRNNPRKSQLDVISNLFSLEESQYKTDVQNAKITEQIASLENIKSQYKIDKAGNELISGYQKNNGVTGDTSGNIANYGFKAALKDTLLRGTAGAVQGLAGLGDLGAEKLNEMLLGDTSEQTAFTDIANFITSPLNELRKENNYRALVTSTDDITGAFKRDGIIGGLQNLGRAALEQTPSMLSSLAVLNPYGAVAFGSAALAEHNKEKQAEKLGTSSTQITDINSDIDGMDVLAAAGSTLAAFPEVAMLKGAAGVSKLQAMFKKATGKELTEKEAKTLIEESTFSKLANGMGLKGEKLTEYIKNNPIKGRALKALGYGLAGTGAAGLAVTKSGAWEYLSEAGDEASKKLGNGDYSSKSLGENLKDINEAGMMGAMTGAMLGGTMGGAGAIINSISNFANIRNRENAKQESIKRNTEDLGLDGSNQEFSDLTQNDANTEYEPSEDQIKTWTDNWNILTADINTLSDEQRNLTSDLDNIKETIYRAARGDLDTKDNPISFKVHQALKGFNSSILNRIFSKLTNAEENTSPKTMLDQVISAIQITNPKFINNILDTVIESIKKKYGEKIKNVEDGISLNSHQTPNASENTSNDIKEEFKKEINEMVDRAGVILSEEIDKSAMSDAKKAKQKEELAKYLERARTGKSSKEVSNAVKDVGHNDRLNRSKTSTIDFVDDVKGYKNRKQNILNSNLDKEEKQKKLKDEIDSTKGSIKFKQGFLTSETQKKSFIKTIIRDLKDLVGDKIAPIHLYMIEKDLSSTRSAVNFYEKNNIPKNNISVIKGFKEIINFLEKIYPMSKFMLPENKLEIIVDKNTVIKVNNLEDAYKILESYSEEFNNNNNKSENFFHKRIIFSRIVNHIINNVIMKNKGKNEEMPYYHNYTSFGKNIEEHRNNLVSFAKKVIPDTNKDIEKVSNSIDEAFNSLKDEEAFAEDIKEWYGSSNISQSKTQEQSLSKKEPVQDNSKKDVIQDKIDEVKAKQELKQKEISNISNQENTNIDDDTPSFGPDPKPSEVKSEVKNEQEITPSSNNKATKLLIGKNVEEAKDLANKSLGIYTLRLSGNNKIKSNIEGIEYLDSNHHFGNPFLSTRNFGNRGVGTDEEVSQMYKNWLLGKDNQNVEPQRRQWIIDQINSGKLDNQNLIYYKNTPINHAKVLQEIINNRKKMSEVRHTQNSNTQSSNNSNKSTPAIDIYSANKDEWNYLTNVTKLESPLVLNIGRQEYKFVSVEHAYQSLKHNDFSKPMSEWTIGNVYNSTSYGGWNVAKKIPGTQGTFGVDDKTLPDEEKSSAKLMEFLLQERAKQDPKFRKLLKDTGNRELTHTKDNKVWKTLFPKLLMKIRDNLNNTTIQSQPNNANIESQLSEVKQEVTDASTKQSTQNDNIQEIIENIEKETDTKNEVERNKNLANINTAEKNNKISSEIADTLRDIIKKWSINLSGAFKYKSSNSNLIANFETSKNKVINELNKAFNSLSLNYGDRKLNRLFKDKNGKVYSNFDIVTKSIKETLRQFGISHINLYIAGKDSSVKINNTANLFFNQDGSVNPQIVAASITAIMQALLSPSLNTTRSMDRLMEDFKNLNPFMLWEYKEILRKGEHIEALAEKIGKSILNNLGWDFNKDVERGDRETLIKELGNNIISVMNNLGLIDISNLPISEIFKYNSGNKATVTYVTLNNDNVFIKESSYKNAFEAFDNLTKELGLENTLEKNTYSTEPLGDVDDNVKTKYGWMKLPARLKNAIRAFRNTPFTVPHLNKVKGLFLPNSKNGDKIVNALKKFLGYVDISKFLDENNKLIEPKFDDKNKCTNLVQVVNYWQNILNGEVKWNSNNTPTTESINIILSKFKTRQALKFKEETGRMIGDLESIKGENLEIEKSIQSMQELLNDTNAIKNGEIEIYFDKQFLMGRNYLRSSGVNPQGNKLHRYLVIPKSTYKTEKVKINDGTITLANSTLKGIAQAFGYSTDKKTKDSIDFAMAIVNTPIEQMQQNMMDILNGKHPKVSFNGKEFILEVEEIGHAFNAYINLVSLHENVKKSKDNTISFTHCILKEADGINNGISLKAQITSLTPRSLRPMIATGIDYLSILGGKTGKTIADFFETQSIKDAYQMTALSLNKYLNNISEVTNENTIKIGNLFGFKLDVLEEDLDQKSLDRINNIKKDINNTRNIFKELLAPTNDGKISKIARNLMKPIVTVKQYGAGDFSAISKLTFFLIDTLKEEILSGKTNGIVTNYILKLMNDNELFFKIDNKIYSPNESIKELFEAIMTTRKPLESLQIISNKSASGDVNTSFSNFLNTYVQEAMKEPLNQSIKEVIPEIESFNNAINGINNHTGHLLNIRYKEAARDILISKNMDPNDLSKLTISEHEEILSRLKNEFSGVTLDIADLDDRLNYNGFLNLTLEEDIKNYGDEGNKDNRPITFSFKYDPKGKWETRSKVVNISEFGLSGAAARYGVLSTQQKDANDITRNMIETLTDESYVSFNDVFDAKVMNAYEEAEVDSNIESSNAKYNKISVETNNKTNQIFDVVKQAYKNLQHTLSFVARDKFGMDVSNKEQAYAKLAYLNILIKYKISEWNKAIQAQLDLDASNLQNGDVTDKYVRRNGALTDSELKRIGLNKDFNIETGLSEDPDSVFNKLYIDLNKELDTNEIDNVLKALYSNNNTRNEFGALYLKDTIKKLEDKLIELDNKMENIKTFLESNSIDISKFKFMENFEKNMKSLEKISRRDFDVLSSKSIKDSMKEDSFNNIKSKFKELVNDKDSKLIKYLNNFIADKYLNDIEKLEEHIKKVVPGNSLHYVKKSLLAINRLNDDEFNELITSKYINKKGETVEKPIYDLQKIVKRGYNILKREASIKLAKRTNNELEAIRVKYKNQVAESKRIWEYLKQNYRNVEDTLNLENIKTTTKEFISLVSKNYPKVFEVFKKFEGFSVINKDITNYNFRTEYNVWRSHVTIAIAGDFTTGGEKLTKSYTEKYKRKFLTPFGNKISEGGNILAFIDNPVGAADSIVEDLKTVIEENKGSIVINIAGNSLASFLGNNPNMDSTLVSDQLNAAMAVFLARLQSKLPDNSIEIRSGLQDGIDMAAMFAANWLGIKYSSLTPVGYRFSIDKGTNYAKIDSKTSKYVYENAPQKLDLKGRISSREFGNPILRDVSYSPGEVFSTETTIDIKQIKNLASSMWGFIHSNFNKDIKDTIKTLHNIYGQEFLFILQKELQNQNMNTSAINRIIDKISETLDEVETNLVNNTENSVEKTTSKKSYESMPEEELTNTLADEVNYMYMRDSLKPWGYSSYEEFYKDLDEAKQDLVSYAEFLQKNIFFKALMNFSTERNAKASSLKGDKILVNQGYTLQTETPGEGYGWKFIPPTFDKNYEADLKITVSDLKSLKMGIKSKKFKATLDKVFHELEALVGNPDLEGYAIDFLKYHYLEDKNDTTEYINLQKNTKTTTVKSTPRKSRKSKSSEPTLWEAFGVDLNSYQDDVNAFNDEDLVEEMDLTADKVTDIQEKMRDLDGNNAISSQSSRRLNSLLIRLANIVGTSIEDIKVKFFETNEDVNRGNFNLKSGIKQVLISKGMIPESDFKGDVTLEETYAHELVHAFTYAAIYALKGFTPLGRELMSLYNRYMSEMTPEKLAKYLNYETSERNLEVAKKIFSSFKTNDSKGLCEFLAIAMTNEGMWNSLAEVKVNEKENTDNMTFSQKLWHTFTSWIDNMISAITKKYHTDTNLQIAMSSLTIRIAQANAKAEFHYNQETKGLLEEVMDSAEKLNSKLSNGIKKFKEDFKASGLNPKRKVLPSRQDEGLISNLLDVAALTIGTLSEPMFKEKALNGLDALGLSHAGTVQSLIDDFTDMNDVQRQAEKFARMSGQIDSIRNGYVTAYSNELASIFKTPLTDIENKRLGEGVLDTDLSSLLEHYSFDELINVLTNLDEHLEKAKDDITSIKVKKNEFSKKYLTIQADSLAYYMVHGRAKNTLESQALCKNAYSIAKVLNQGVDVEPDLDLVNKIDKYVTLRALKYTSKDIVNTLILKLRNEPEAMQKVLNTHNNFKKLSLKNNFNNNPLLMIKGYRKDIFDDSRSMKISTLDDEKLLASQGFKLALVLKQSPGDKSKPRGIFISTFVSPSVGFNRQAIRFTSHRSRGTKLGDIFNARILKGENIDNVKKEWYETLEGLKQETFKASRVINSANYVSQIEENMEAVLQPIYNDKGDLVDFSYVMNKATKKDLLGLDTSLTSSLGHMYAGMYDKTESKKLNSKINKFLAKDYFNAKEVDPFYKVSFTEFSFRNKDPYIRELYKMMDEETLKELQSYFGEGNPIMLRKQTIKNFFGMRDMDFKNTKFYLENPNYPLFKKSVVLAQDLIKTIAKQYKFEIVLRMPGVILGNIISNIIICTIHGMSPLEAYNMHCEGLKNLKLYQRQMKELQVIKVRSKMGEKIDKIKLENLQRAMANNPVAPLIEHGLWSTIQTFEDVNVAEKDNSYVARIFDKYVPEDTKLRGAIDAIYVTNKTTIGQQLTNIVQASDFMARYALYYRLQKINASRSKEEKWSEKDILNRVSDEFINYDLPTSKLIKFFNDYGLTTFTRYATRIQKNLIKLGEDRPLYSAMYLAFQAFLGIDFTDPFEGAAPVRNWTALLHDPYHNFVDAFVTPPAVSMVEDLHKQYSKHF